jgi:hypothetical protein
MSAETAGRQASVMGGHHTKRVSPQLAEQERQQIIYQLERERFDTWKGILDSCSVEAKRQVLAVLLINDGVCTYKDLFDNIARSDRRIKKHVYDLEDTGIVNRSGNPTFVSFVDTDVSLLVSDALNLTDPV